MYLTLFARSIDLEQKNLLAPAMGEQSRMTAYRFLKVLFVSMLDFFPETRRVASRNSTQAIPGETTDRSGEDRRLLEARGKRFEGPHARSIASSKPLKLRYGCQGSRLTVTGASMCTFHWRA
jgi:hypothetical protein